MADILPKGGGWSLHGPGQRDDIDITPGRSRGAARPQSPDGGGGDVGLAGAPPQVHPPLLGFMVYDQG